MAQDFFGLEKGIRIYDSNSDDNIVILSGAGTPDTSADFTAAEIGSLYIRRGTGELYQKGANTGAASDWVITGGSQIGTFRPEKIRAVTNDSVTSGVARDLTASPFSDDDGTQLSASDFTAGEFAIISDALFEVTNVSAPNVTFTAVSAELSLNEGDTFVAINYLPDTPGDQEGQALVQYNGSVCVKVADIDFAFSNGIGIAPGYSAAAGNVTTSDTIQTALEKIDGVNDAQDTLLGTSQGDTTLPNFSGSTISDGQSVVGALQDLELAHEEVDQNVNDLITLSGSPENAVDHGAFATTVIPDNSTTKGALEALGAKDEAQDGIISEIDANVDDLITLSGVAENSTNLGVFTGFGAILWTATETIKSALQKTSDFLGGLRSVEATGITTQSTVDSVPVATVQACAWQVTALEEATPTNRSAVVIYALNDGTSADFTTYAKLKVGSNFNVSYDVSVSGGNMLLQASSSTAGITVRARRISVEDI